MAWGVGVTG